MLSVAFFIVVQNVIMLRVVMLNVIILNVVAPFKHFIKIIFTVLVLFSSK